MKKFMYLPPEDYIDIEKSLNTTVIEISSGSEDEVIYNLGHNILVLYSILVQIRFSQVKGNLISSIGNLVNELPHELQNYLRLRIL